MISPEDESLLSAYLDGELDPIERRAVESALAADSQLAARIRDLLTVRDLVADLSRPTAPDVSSVVVRSIVAGLARPRPWKSVRRNLPWLATALATAAAIVILVIGPLFHHTRTVPDPGDQNHMAATGPRAEHKRDARAEATPTVRMARPGSSAEKPDGPQESGDAATKVALRPADQREAFDRTRLRSLIDDPRLQRVFLVTDQIGGPAEEQVASLVERTTRHDYFKITISQGIVIDPRHPDRAVVFAVVLDETELTPFHTALKEEFRDHLQDHEVDPAVALQLADIGQVVSLPAHPVAKVTIPRENIALLTDGPTLAQERSAPRIPDSVQPSELDPGHGGRPLPSQTGAAPARVADSGRPGGAVADHPANESPLYTKFPHDIMHADDHHLIVLVWVTGTNSG